MSRLFEDPRVLPRPASHPRGAALSFDFEGRLVRAHEGESVAVALWAAGVRTLARSTKYHRPRGLFCLRGQCGSCLMRIDGQPNRRACMTPVRKELRCERQSVFATGDADLLEAADLLFPQGMDHHTMATSSSWLNRVFLKVVRQVAGAAALPEASEGLATGGRFSLRDETCDVLVVGGGPAGLAAAAACARSRPGCAVRLVDDQPLLGGSLWSEPDGAARIASLVAEARAAGVRLSSDTVWFGAYPEDAVGPQAGAGADEALTPAVTELFGAVMALADARGLVRVRARRAVFATGAYDQNLAFENNDRPGILSARAVGRLAFRDGIHPGRVALLGAATSYATVLARGLEAYGIGVLTVEIVDGKLVPTSGGALPAYDVLAVDALPAPATEPLRLCGLPVAFVPARGGFVLDDDGKLSSDGRTGDRHLFVAGDVTGWRGSVEAEEHGRRVGQIVAGSL